MQTKWISPKNRIDKTIALARRSISAQINSIFAIERGFFVNEFQDISDIW